MGKRGQNEGSITYLKSRGKWSARLYLGVDATGKAKRWQVYGDTKEAVRKALVEAQADKQRGELIASPRQSVAEYLQSWLTDTIQPSRSLRTYESYRLNVNRALPHLGRHQLASLKAPHLQAMYASLLKAGLARRSVEQCHTVIHTALAQAVRWRMLPYNPADLVTVPRSARHEMQTLSAPQLARLFAGTEAERLHSLWVTLATTGLRMGEALGLRWQDVDFDACRLTVRQSVQRQKGKGIVPVPVKSHRSRRPIALSGFTVKALRRHKTLIAAERLASADWQESDLVYPSRRGTPLDTCRVNGTWHRTLVRLGLPSVRLHDLRHTVASLALANGVHPKLVQELLGHSSIALTLDTYSHIIPTSHDEIADHMDRLFSQSS